MCEKYDKLLMLTLKKSGVMTEIYQISPSFTAGHLTLAISEQTNKILKSRQTDMTANSSSRLCLPLCKEKTKEYLSDVVAPRPCQTHTGH